MLVFGCTLWRLLAAWPPEAALELLLNIQWRCWLQRNTALRLLLLAQNSTSLKPPTAALNGKRQEVINILRELGVSITTPPIRFLGHNLAPVTSN